MTMQTLAGARFVNIGSYRSQPNDDDHEAIPESPENFQQSVDLNHLLDVANSQFDPDAILQMASESLDQMQGNINVSLHAIQGKNEQSACLKAVSDYLDHWQTTHPAGTDNATGPIEKQMHQEGGTWVANNPGQNGASSADYVDIDQDKVTVTVNGASEQMTIAEALRRSGVNVGPESTTGGDNGHRFNSDNLSQLRDEITNGASSLTEDSQELSLELQTAVNKRQEAVQMYTNLLASIHDTDKAVLQNVGH